MNLNIHRQNQFPVFILTQTNKTSLIITNNNNRRENNH